MKNETGLFGVPISITSKERALAVITGWVLRRQETGDGRRAKVVITPNPEIIMMAQKNPRLLTALQHTDLSIADGWGIAIAERLLNSKFKTQKSKVERISGISLMEALVEKAVHKGWRVMLVGGKEGIAQKAAETLNLKFEAQNTKQSVRNSNEQHVKNRFNHLDFENSDVLRVLNLGFRIFSLSGPVDIFNCPPEEMNKIIIAINRFKPDLLFVAFGPGRQEVWIQEWRNRLCVGVAMGVGGALDQLADPTLRAPSSIDGIGLGWLWRLGRQPWRWRRQIALMTFLKMVIKVRMAEWLKG